MTGLPQTLGGFEVLHALKAGGMGEVLLARRRGPAGFEQLCAIKTIRPELANAPLVRTMFLDEARLLARLTHPAIAQILDFGDHEGVVYMVMEYVAGEHFRRFAERRPPPAIVCQALASACRGLHAAHELRDLNDGHLLGVVHRDISPDNLMVGFDGRVKVLDFGIALVKGRQAPATELGVLKGKPPYMSPEALRNHELDRRADVFSVAVVLHELLTGQHLFTGDSIYAVVHAVEHQAIQPPSAVAGPLPADLDDVVMAGLQRDRDKRLRSAAAMAEVLERIAAQSGGESLESWAERELVGDREAHREWMAKVMTRAGSSSVGRPTGVVTALAELPPPPVTDATDVDPQHEAMQATALAGVWSVPPIETGTEPAPPVTEAGSGPKPAPPSTMATQLAPPPRRRAMLAIAAALVLAAVVALVLVVIGRGEKLVARPIDAGVDAAVVPADAPPAVDATAVIDLPVDAAPPVDARAPRPHEADGGLIVRPIDAGAPPRIDAAVAAAGTGFLSLGAEPSANVTVDGTAWGPTNIFKQPIPAGSHTVVFFDPYTGLEFNRQTVLVGDGRLVTVKAPARTKP